MTTLAEQLEGFAALATALTGIRTEQKDMPQKMIDPAKKGRLEYRVISCRPVAGSSDEIRFSDDGDNLLMSSEGLRALTIQVTFKGYDQRYTQNALFYLERLGNRLVWPSSLATLRALDLGLIDRGTFQDFSDVESAEDRRWSVGVKDFMLHAVVTETPDNPADNPMSWIETVEFASDTLDGTDDLPLPTQISATVTRP